MRRRKAWRGGGEGGGDGGDGGGVEELIAFIDGGRGMGRMILERKQG